MTPVTASVGAVTARIAAIESRFTPAGGFAAALATARQPGASGSAAPATQDVTSPAAATTAGVPAPVLAPPSAYAVRISEAAAAAPSTAAAGEWASRLPAAGRQWAGAIESAAREAGVDPTLLAALVWAESGFRADAGSGAGAIGLTQLMPGTARGLGVDPHDPLQNLRGGARYLAQQLDRFGSPSLALAAYNAGPGAVAKHGGIPPYSETRAYVPRVLGYQQQLKGAS